MGKIEAMRINNSGKVGIGTNSPAAGLDVKGPAGMAQFNGTYRLGLTVRSATLCCRSDKDAKDWLASIY